MSLKDLGGALLVVSQFTLYGDLRRGLRPSWSDAAQPELQSTLRILLTKARSAVESVEAGSFRKMMQVN